MHRATTPTFSFTLPVDTSLVSNFIISFAQGGVVKLEKTKKDCTCSDKVVSVTLTEAEANLFSHKLTGQIQIRAKLTDNQVVASNILEFNVHRVFNEVEL